MTNDSARSARSWWIWALAAVGAVALVSFAAVVGLVAVPAMLANVRTHVSSSDEPLVLESQGVSATIAVPTGWLVTSQDDAHALIATPDRGMTVDVSLAAASPESVAAEQGVVSPLTEPLASGLTVVHGAVSDEASGSSPVRLVAAVGEVGGGSVVFAVRSDDLDRYRPSLAELVEAVEP